MGSIVIVRRSGERHTILFDDEDEEIVDRYRWCIGAGRLGSRYAINGHTGIFLHRLILELPPRKEDPGRREVDHRNGNKLDNRRKNLRVVSHQENSWGYQPPRSACGHRGVTWDRARGKWSVGVARDGRRHYGGRYDDLALAVAAAERLREEVFGAGHSPTLS